MAENKQRKPLSTSEQEIALLKTAFAGNEQLLKSVRALFLGFPLNSDEASLIRVTFQDKDLVRALRKKMYPEIDPASDIGELSDFWLGTETEVIGKDKDTIRQVVLSKQRTQALLEHAFSLLSEPTGNVVDLSFDMPETDPYMIKLLARSKYIKSVETGLTILKVIAGQKDETPEEAKKRLLAESSK